MLSIVTGADIWYQGLVLGITFWYEYIVANVTGIKCYAYCPKSNSNFQYITRNIEESEILYEIFRVISRFPPYISCYISDNRLPLEQCHYPEVSLWLPQLMPAHKYQQVLAISIFGHLSTLVWNTFAAWLFLIISADTLTRVVQLP